MKILFVMLHPGYIRYYDGAIRLLAASGHDVQLAFEVTRDKLGEDVTAEQLAASSPRIVCEASPARGEGVGLFLARADRTATRSGDLFRAHAPRSQELAWESLATTVRLMLDYLRYFEPTFVSAYALRARAGKRLPQLHEGVVRTVARCGRAARSLLTSTLAGFERLIPTSDKIKDFVLRHNPDLLLVTPLIELGSQQVDYVKCARQLGIPSVLCVASWDNLTSKGLIRVAPDHVIVWNEAQRSEATTLHGVAPEHVRVTGAQLFDDWFKAKPGRSRAEFCAAVGLDPDRPFVLYVGSSIFIAPEEVPFAERWLCALRSAADPDVSSLGVLFRPHPANSRQWRAFDGQAFPNVAIWPPLGTNPNDPDFRRDFFDSLYHSAAVVGVNTSAQLEAAIVGRPVFTVRAQEFQHAQEGTLHFQHLVARGGGGVQSAERLDEHLAQVATALRLGVDRDARDEFVRAFIRPHGLEHDATPVFAEVIEGIGREAKPPAQPEPRTIRVLRPMAALVARVALVLAEDRPLWVYLLRPCVTVGTWAIAPGFWARESGAEAVRRWRKVARRAMQRARYESGKAISRKGARLRKVALKRVMSAGAGAKRLLGMARKSSP